MANCANKNRLSHQGFTLVEMAIVLVIVGLLIGIGTGMVGVLSTAAKVRETRDSLDANMQAIASWASANNRLPDTTSTPATNPVLFANVAKTPNDSWGRSFIYLYDSALAPGTATKDTICGRRSTVISLTDSNNPGTTISNIAYLVISQADDAKTDTKISSTAVLLGQQITTTTTIAADTVNDLVRWVTLDELRSKVGCQGAPLKIVNNELPFGSVPNYSTYSVTLTADGGVPFTPATPYQWCVYSPGQITAALPTGFTQTGGVVDSPTGTACTGLAGGSWGSASSGLKLSMSSTVTAGSYNFTIVARDNADPIAANSGLACSGGSNDNCVQKVFVLTVNPN
jgi:prepilin-type N-terminal cleavage/methylation domain-containing protein